MMDQLVDIANQFAVRGAVGDIAPFGSGHINDTYLMQNKLPGAEGYILQRKNHYVFKDVPAMMENIGRVTRHITEKLSGGDALDTEITVARLIDTRDGRNYYRDDDGNYWCVMEYIPDSVSYDVVTDPALAFEGGRAFGVFQRLVSDLPPPPLHETIVDFHNMLFRFRQFNEALEQHLVDRWPAAKSEVAFAQAREQEMCDYYRLLIDTMPQRVTHNDTKFNNILFDRHGHARCIIDLDTVMPGYVHYDFGDSIRTVANTGKEDDEDLDTVGINLEIFRAYAGGYLSEMLDALSTAEAENLAFSCRYMTFIMGLRFLTDYLTGDKYYKIGYPEHNLQRARAQFRLVASMEQHYDAMKGAIRTLARGGV
jgi:hypothetical protein